MISQVKKDPSDILIQLKTVTDVTILSLVIVFDFTDPLEQYDGKRFKAHHTEAFLITCLFLPNTYLIAIKLYTTKD